MKRSILICLVLCLIAPITIDAQKEPFGNGLYWELSDGTLTVSGYGEMPNTPEPWHSKKGIIRAVVIENGITTIKDGAFSDCKRLIKVSLPNSLTSIGKFAFHNCTDLTLVKIPNSVTTIGESAFYSCI